jgi:hypothetical protein
MRTGNHTHLLTIDRRIDMLKIVDLNRNEELSSSEMGKVVGGVFAGIPIIWRPIPQMLDALPPLTPEER